MAIKQHDANAVTLESIHRRWLEPPDTSACRKYCNHCLDEILPFESNFVMSVGRIHELCFPEYAAERMGAELTWGTEDDL